VRIGACANIQQQPKGTGGCIIEERGNYGKDWCMNYSMHRIRSYAPILHKGRAQQMGTEVYGTR
jgi:hypothetical protein